jgi:hypothetical protein
MSWTVLRVVAAIFSSSRRARDTVVTPKPNAVAMVFSVGFLLRRSNQCACVLVCFLSVAPVTLLLFLIGSTLSCSTGEDRFPG